MPLPEGYLPREGDVLVLHAVVKHDVDESDRDRDDGLRVFIRLGGDYQDRRIPLKNVVGIHCRKWNADDRVVTRDGVDGTVLAVSDNVCWVKLDTGTFASIGANNLDASNKPADVEMLPAPAGAPDQDDDEINF